MGKSIVYQLQGYLNARKIKIDVSPVHTALLLAKVTKKPKVRKRRRQNAAVDNVLLGTASRLLPSYHLLIMEADGNGQQLFLMQKNFSSNYSSMLTEAGYLKIFLLAFCG